MQAGCCKSEILRLTLVLSGISCYFFLSSRQLKMLERNTKVDTDYTVC